MTDPELFGKTRARVCGLLIKDNSILLLKHEGLGPEGFIWSPPGGGIEFDETAEEALIREFKEEVSLEIEVDDFLFVNEYFDKRLHAIELFFSVTYVSGVMKLGSDPEYSEENQIITEAKFLPYDKLDIMTPSHKHNAFRFCRNSQGIINLRGFYNFRNI